MATKNIVPRATGEGSLGTSAKKWGTVNAGTINADVLSLGGTTVTDFVKTLLAKSDASSMRDAIGAIAANCGGIVASSLNYNGYAKFANGLIIQYGSQTFGSGYEYLNFDLPVSFKSSWAIYACFDDKSHTVKRVTRDSNNSSFKLYADSVVNSDTAFMMIAVGW